MKQVSLIISLFTFFSIYSFGQSQSQKVNIEWGPKQKIDKKINLDKIISTDETGIYVLKKKIKGAFQKYPTLFIEHYDNSLKLSKTVELELKAQEKELKFEFIVPLNNNIFIFSSFQNKKLEKKILFIQKLNKKTLQPGKDLKIIAEIDYSKKTSSFSGFFGYTLSKDSSKFLLYSELPFTKDEKERFNLQIFDQNLIQLWKKNITLPYKDDLFRIKKYKINKEGEPYFLAKVLKPNKTAYKNDELNYDYAVLGFLDNGNQLKEYPIKTEDKILTDMHIEINSNQDVFCAGLYSTAINYQSEGFYFMKISGETKEVEANKFQNFSMNLITQYLTDKEKEKINKRMTKGKEIGLKNLWLNKIILKNEGGAYLIGQQYYVNRFDASTVKFIYEDIITISMGADGKTEWTEKIAKKQISLNDYGLFSSYALAYANDKLNFIFNDSPKNLHYNGNGEIKAFSNSKKAITVLVTLDSEGRKSKEFLYRYKDIEVFTRSKVCKQSASNEMIVFGRKKKSQRLGKIIFKE